MTAVVGIRDHETNQIASAGMQSAKKGPVDELIDATVHPEAVKYTDESNLYLSLDNHRTVTHSKGQYVAPSGATTNRLESHWSMFKRGFYGTYHKMSPKHLDRYAKEFSGRHNVRPFDTLDQMGIIASSFDKKRMRYKDLIRNNGLSSGSRTIA